MSELKVNTITDASGGNTASINGATPTTDNTMGKNRLINGDMRIDQRNAGASVTVTSSDYFLDRWRLIVAASSKISVQQNAGSVSTLAGFPKYLGVTSLAATSVGSTDEYVLYQKIEGFYTSDLAWGTANASSITLSFKVYSSLTGTFGGAINNSDQSRSYPFSYSISSANTWTSISITIPGDTTGSWVGDTNGVGIIVRFGLGVGSTYLGTPGSWSSSAYDSCTGATSVVGTNGATFYITGVQLEAGSVATSFERRSYGQELALCQRYFYKTYNTETAVGENTSVGLPLLETIAAGTLNRLKIFNASFPVTMRTTPTVTVYGQAGNINSVSVYNNSASTLAVSGLSRTGATTFGGYVTTSTNASASQSYSAHFTASAEL